MTSRNATFNGHTNHVGQACDCQGRNQRQSNVVAEIDHQGCRNCFHSSAVIDALWNKIAKLDRQIVKVSAEKAAAEDALLCVIQVQAKAQAATAEQTRITSKAKNQVEPTFTSLTSSFSSNTTLAEPDSKDREQVSANLADKDALLIDLWAEEIDSLRSGSGIETVPESSDTEACRTGQTPSSPIYSYNRYFAKPYLSSSAEHIDNEAGAKSSTVTPGKCSVSQPKVKKPPPQGLEASIWADTIEQDKQLIASRHATKPEDVELAKKPARGPLWARTRLAGSLEEFEAHLGKANGTINARNHFHLLERYYICYTPGPIAQDVYRTVFISGIPSTCSVAKLLNQVRGGMVVDAKLIDVPALLGLKSALITFLHEESARNFEDYFKSRFLRIDEVEIPVSLLPTPTWPLTKRLAHAISAQGCTRCLKVENFPKQVDVHGLCADLEGTSSTAMSNIEDVIFHGNEVEIRFLSIESAQRAFEVLKSMRYVYGKCKIDHAMDPCERPLKSLKGIID